MLNDLVSVTAVFLKQVNSIEITLTMHDTGRSGIDSPRQHHTPMYNCDCNYLAGVLPAMAVKTLSPACGQLTSLTVTGTLPYSNPCDRPPSYDFVPILQSLHDSSAAHSLLSLTISFDASSAGAQRLARSQSPDSDYSQIYKQHTCLFDSKMDATGEGFDNNMQTCSLLRGLVTLESLHLTGMCVGSEGWLAMPESLTQLNLYRAHVQPPHKLRLPLLKQLVLNTCECGSLVLLLHELPNSTAIELKWLTVNAGSRQSIKDLTSMFTHSVKNPDQQQSKDKQIARSVCVKGLDLYESNPCEVSLSDFLATIPVMSTVTDCGISLYHKSHQDGHILDIGEAYLKHMPLVLPSLEQLSFDGRESQTGPPTKKSVLALESLKSLRRLKIVTKYGVSWDQLQEWKELLPGIVEWKVNIEGE